VTDCALEPKTTTFPTDNSPSGIANRLLSTTFDPPHKQINMATTSDLDQLIDMGFDPEKSKIALRKTGGRKSERLAICIY
jgi:hypothetical protein